MERVEQAGGLVPSPGLAAAKEQLAAHMASLTDRAGAIINAAFAMLPRLSEVESMVSTAPAGALLGECGMLMGLDCLAPPFGTCEQVRALHQGRA